MNLCEKDILWGLLAIQVASLQFGHVDDDELGQRLTNQLSEVAAALASIDLQQKLPEATEASRPQEQEEIQPILIEAAAGICVGRCEARPEEAVRQFRDAVSEKETGRVLKEGQARGRLDPYSDQEADPSALILTPPEPSARRYGDL